MLAGSSLVEGASTALSDFEHVEEVWVSSGLSFVHVFPLLSVNKLRLFFLYEFLMNFLLFSGGVSGTMLIEESSEEYESTQSISEIPSLSDSLDEASDEL